jgi:hypothetical protein
MVTTATGPKVTVAFTYELGEGKDVRIRVFNDLGEARGVHRYINMLDCNIPVQIAPRSFEAVIRQRLTAVRSRGIVKGLLCSPRTLVELCIQGAVTHDDITLMHSSKDWPDTVVMPEVNLYGLGEFDIFAPRGERRNFVPLDALHQPLI